MNRTKAIAIMSAGLLSFSLSACGGPELTESEVLDPTKHVRWASESLMPQWNDAKMVINPLAAVPEAARELPETLALESGNRSNPFELNASTVVPASLAVSSFDDKANVLDLSTGAVYEVGPDKFQNPERARSAATMLVVSDEGKTKGASILATVEETQGLQAERTHMSTFLSDFASSEEPALAVINSKIAEAEDVRVLAASPEKIYLGTFSEAGSDLNADIVAIDVASGEETGYEHFETSSFLRWIAQRGAPVIFYADKEDDLRARNLESGKDFEVRKDFVPGAVWRFGENALIYGREKSEDERCMNLEKDRCEVKLVLVGEDKVVQEASFEMRPSTRVPGMRRSGDFVTLTALDPTAGYLEKIITLNPVSGEVLLELNEDELQDLNIHDAISDGESLFTPEGNSVQPRIAQSDLATKRLVNADADVFPIDSPSGARIWGVKQDDGKDFEARVAVEDLDKF